MVGNTQSREENKLRVCRNFRGLGSLPSFFDNIWTYTSSFLPLFGPDADDVDG